MTPQVVEALGFDSPGEETDLAKFLRRYRLEESDITPAKAPYVAIAVGEWSHQLRAGNRARTTFTALQFLAPTVAALATILAAFESTSAWAVVPSAITTVLASLLAAFALRGVWFLRKRLRHELGQEIIEFIKDVGAYRPLSEHDRVDRLMAKVRDATMASAPAN